MSTNANDIVSLLSDCQAAAATYRDASGSNWVPPKGTYNVALENVAAKSYVKDGAKIGILEMNLQILDGDFAGKSFELPIFQNNKVSGSVLKDLVTLIGAAPSENAEMAFAVDAGAVANAVGRTFAIERSEKPNKKDPAKPYTNWKFKAVLS